MPQIPFQKIDWTQIEKIAYPGDTGVAYWQTLELAGLRIRVVQYGVGYLADHWCRKGHIVHCLDGEFETELSTGDTLMLTCGQSYIVSDDMSAHRSFSQNGTTLLIIDGDFLAK